MRGKAKLIYGFIHITWYGNFENDLGKKLLLYQPQIFDLSLNNRLKKITKRMLNLIEVEKTINKIARLQPTLLKNVRRLLFIKPRNLS